LKWDGGLANRAMSFTGNLPLFLGTVAVISVTGALMPGPVTAAVVAKGYRNRWAGLHIALGHAAVEFPTIALMALGFSAVLRDRWVNIGIGLLGGAMLVFLGVSMLISRGGVAVALLAPPPSVVTAGTDIRSGAKRAKAAGDPFPYHPFLAGIITTASNPYYFLWWATLGAALTLNALEFGLAVLLVFAVLHWSIDLGWDVLLSFTVHSSRGLWDRRVYVAVFALCGGVMVFFGLWFAAGAVYNLVVPG